MKYPIFFVLNPKFYLSRSISWYLFLLSISIACFSCVQRNESLKSETDLVQVDSVLQSLLATWYPVVKDTVQGGYYSTFTYDWQLAENQPKTLLNHTRTLWTLSKAYSFYPDRDNYKALADHGFQYIITHLYDSIHGGFHSTYPSSENTFYKSVYENAFAIYALSEYAKINKAPEVKQYLEKAFEWFEEKARDPVYKGYFHFVFNKGSRQDYISEKFLNESGWGNADWKNQNTSIHILEAFTNMYEVMPSPILKERLEEIFLLVRDKMVRKEGHLALYFKSDWTPISHQDSSKAYIFSNKRFDHISFGHDIETAFLLLESAKVLYGSYDETTLQVAQKLTQQSLLHGMDQNSYGMFYEGYRFSKNKEVEIINDQKAWWVQAEAWHTCMLMQHLFPDNELYKEAGNGIWQYILEQVIDKQHGGWYSNGLDTRPQSKTQNKAHPWKNAYHNGRALMQVLQLGKSNHYSR